MKNLDVREIRKACGLTQRELASEMGVNLSTVWRWENVSPPSGPARALLAAMADREKSLPKKGRAA
ncbi:helix-turn-helix domain-containing protein [Nitratireductor aestuarii]